MKYWISFAVVFSIAIILTGCGGSGRNKTSQMSGTIEGFVYVPQNDKTAVNVTRAAEPPLGYIPLYGADVKVEIAGQVRKTKTDTNGHFRIGNLPSGTAKVTITPPLIGETGLAEFFAFTTTMEVKANTTAVIGSDGNISLISISADHLEVIINQIDISDFPKVRVYVSVIDPIRNTPIIGLDTSNFQILVAQTQIGITDFSQIATNSSPASVCLVLDRSGSMDGQPLVDLKNSAKQFVSYLGNDDRGEIISFSESTVRDCPYTNNKSELVAAIDQLQSGGATALYDAIYKGLEDTINELNRRKAVIAMTDGGENASVNATLDKIISLAKQSGVPIYTIGLQGYGFTREPIAKEINQTRSEQDLQQIARETGGEYFYVPQSSDLMGIYTKITQRQQQQYILTIEDPDPQKNGLRTVEVKVNACSLLGSGSSEYDHNRYCYPVNQTMYETRMTQEFYEKGPNGIHLGEDIDLQERTPIQAIGDGTIVWYSEASGYGELIVAVEHDLGRTVQFNLSIGQTKQVSARYIYSIYGHIRSMAIRGEPGLPWKVGDTIKPGQTRTIGYINDDAHNGIGGEHLHMGIRFSDQRLPPNEWYYYGLEDASLSRGKDFGAFSEVIQQLP